MQRSRRKTAPHPRLWLSLATVAILLTAGLPAAAKPASPQLEPRFMPDELIVKFHLDVTPSRIDQLIAACGAEVVQDTNTIIDGVLSAPGSRVRELPEEQRAVSRNAFWLRMPGSQLKPRAEIEPVPREALSSRLRTALDCFAQRSDDVEFAQPNLVGSYDSHRQNNHPNDPNFANGNQWSLLNVGQPALGQAAIGSIDADIDIMMAWDLPHTNCSSVVIGMMDSGIDLVHADLQGNLWANPQEAAGVAGVDDDGNGFVDDINGWNFGGGGQPQDTLGHGTNVAGVMGAVGNNGIDVAGICWQAQIMTLGIGNPSAAAVQMSAAYIVAQRAAGQNVRVVNISAAFGGTPANIAALQNAANQLQAAGILWVIAAGNSGLNVDVNAVYPCVLANTNIVCVASSSNQDLLSGFSNFGATNVDLAAPGENIATTQLGGGVQAVSGTSFSAPHTTAMIALAMALFPAKTNAQIVTDILNGAVAPQPASGVDVVKTTAGSTIFGQVASGGRMRWPYAADLGDAPNSYGTIAATSRGALHWDTGNEYIGTDVTPEVDANTPGNLDQDPTANIIPAPNMDFADEPILPGNGAFFFNPPPPWLPNQNVTVFYTLCSDHFGILDADGGRYQSVLDRSIFVNGWFDMNQNGTFEAGEFLLEDIHSPPPGPAPPAKPGFPNVTINTIANLPAPAAAPAFPATRQCRPVLSSFTVPQGGTPSWVRFRLDYGEDVGFNVPNGNFNPDPNDPPAQHLGRVKHGDVEDFDLRELDHFEETEATVTVSSAAGDFTFNLVGPTTINVDLTAIKDYDGDGFDEAPAEMLDVELTGDSIFGPVIVRLRDPSKSPFQTSGGFIEENQNLAPGVLDLPPFAHNGTAQSSFDVYFELELPDLGLTLHNEDPKKMETEILYKPPCDEEVYTGAAPVALYDESGADVGVTLEVADHTPKGKRPPPPEYCHPEGKMSILFPGRKLFIEELCHPPKAGKSIPAQVYFDRDAALECMDSTLEFLVSIDEDVQAKESVVLTGPVCIQRSAPYLDADGLMTIDTEMVLLEMVGHSEVAGAMTVTLAPGKATPGQIKQSREAADLDIDISPVTPADSWFDVSFVIYTDLYGESEPTTSKVTAQIISVPPGRLLDSEQIMPIEPKPKPGEF